MAEKRLRIVSAILGLDLYPLLDVVHIPLAFSIPFRLALAAD